MASLPLDDVRAAGRSLLRSPRHVLLTAGCLALGLGVNAVMFGVMDALFLRPPAGVRDPSRVVRVYFNRSPRPGTRIIEDRTSFPIFTDIRRDAGGLRQAAAYYPTTVSEGSGRDAMKLRASLVTGDYFSLLGVLPSTGRALLPADSRPGSAGVAVISDALWRRRFGAKASAMGQTLLIAEHEYRIVGVASREFTGVDLDPIDVWLPLELSASDLIYPGYLDQRGAWAVSILGRLGPGITPRQTEAEATRAFLNGDRTFAGYDSTANVTIGPLLRDLGPKPSDQAKVSKWLAGVALAVLLIACVNCASLMLLRTVRRQRELALRSALGATRLRLVRAMVLEHIGLALVGAVAAAGVASVATRVLGTLLLPDGAPVGALSLPRLFAFTLIVALGAGLLSGLPALRYVSRRDLTSMLASGARAGGRRGSGQNALLVVQIGLTVLLLVGTGLFVASLRNVRALDMGFRPSGVVAATIDFSGMTARMSASAASPDLVYRRFEDAIRALPGVQSVAFSSSIPFGDVSGTRISVPGRDPVTLPNRPVFLIVASQNYLSTIGLQLVGGRWFEQTDYGSGAQNAVINESMARIYWPGESAIGKCLVAGEPQCRRIVGIVRDTRQMNLREDPRGQLYVPDINDPHISARLPRTLVVRTTRGVNIAADVRRAIQSVNPTSAFVSVQPVEALVAPKVRPWNLGATMFTLFGMLALTLAAVGLYGSVSYAVTERTHEIGVRMALGATGARILRLVVVRGLIVIVAGVALGSGAAVWLAPRVEDLLFGIHARNPATFGFAISVVIVAALTACVAPVRRATRVDPLEVLNSV